MRRLFLWCNLPKFAEQPAQLISLTFTDRGVVANPFDLLNHQGVMYSIGFEAKHPDEKLALQRTVKWLKKPSTLMCFPDNSMGPDIIMFIRVADATLAVLVQCKWRAKKTLDARTLKSAVKSINLDNIYKKYVRT